MHAACGFSDKGNVSESEEGDDRGAGPDGDDGSVSGAGYFSRIGYGMYPLVPLLPLLYPFSFTHLYSFSL
jgi:hypothetical protein